MDVQPIVELASCIGLGTGLIVGLLFGDLVFALKR